MHDLAQIVSLIVRIEIILIFARVLLSWFPGIPPWHPLVRALASVTDPVLLPFRRLLPTIGGLDFSPIVAIVALQLVGGFVVDLIEPRGGSLAFSLAIAARDVVHTVLLILIIIVVARLVVSFLRVSPFHPAVRLVRDISTPLVRPFAGVGGRSSATDVPAIVALVVYVVLIVVADRLLDDLVTSTAPTIFSS
ncbi:MAG TPA: YggT family protein [Candidatus Dormibacteraeota bacterium]